MPNAVSDDSVKERIAFLDGHRGLAILLVIGFHAFARWPALIPNDCCAAFPVFQLGWLGVELFFLVSGFVILMTLERCASASIFLRRRWLRLFPAMLICSLLIYASAPWFHERPAGAPEPASLLPGWFFMELSWTRTVFGHVIKPLESSFWTLYVEVKFYVFAALVYYRFGRQALVWTLFGTASADYALNLLHLVSGNRMVFVLERLGEDLGLDYWFWFASGAAFYVHRQTRQAVWLRLALVGIVAGSSSLALPHQAGGEFGWPILVGGLLVGAVFALSNGVERVQAVLESRVLQFFGFISYPLYLLHENMLIASLLKFAAWVPRELYPLAVLAVLAPLAWLAWGVARVAEPKLRKGLAWLLDRAGERLPALRGGSTKARPDSP